jgi:hypothetical protein
MAHQLVYLQAHHVQIAQPDLMEQRLVIQRKVNVLIVQLERTVFQLGYQQLARHVHKDHIVPIQQLKPHAQLVRMVQHLATQLSQVVQIALAVHMEREQALP